MKVLQLARLRKPLIVVYQAYGQPLILKQTLMSLVSLLYQLRQAHTSDLEQIKFVIYTDDKNYFQDFFGNHSAIFYEPMTTEILRQWRGKIDFVHRVKIEVLRDARTKYSGDLFYMDGDTYFIAPPLDLWTQIKPDTSLMHEREGRVSENYNPVAKKIHKFLQTEKSIPAATDMWNAGVLGIAQENLHWLDEVLALTDDLHAKFQKHVIEQLAFSYVLQNRGNIAAADLVIAHYWRNKDAFNTYIENFLTKHTKFAPALNAYAEIDWPSLHPPKPSLLEKLRKKLKF